MGKKQLTKDLPKHPVIGANTWLPKPFFFPEEEMIVCPPEPTACVFPPEMLNRPEVAECGEELIVCRPPEQEFVKPPTVIMGGPPSKFGSGLPPGASVRLLEEREGMSMVQLRGQERDEDEVDDEMDRKKKNIRKQVRDEMKKDKEKKKDVKKQVKKQLTKDLPKHPVIGANTWLPKPYFKPQPKPFFFPEEEMIVCPPEPTACVF